MNRLLLNYILVNVLLLGTSHAFAAKPGGGGTKDTTAPAAIYDLSTVSTMFALRLRFTEVGDDGTTGTAAGYDVRYREESGGGCADDPATWTLAARADTTAPAAAGAAQGFNVRPLNAGTSYCLAIRVRDEVPNWSDWARASTATLDAGSWALTTYASSANPQYLVGPGAAVTGPNGTALGWQSDVYSGSHLARVVFSGDGWQTEVDLSNLIDNNYLANATFAAVPPGGEGEISALMAGSGGTGDRYVLIEGAGSTRAPTITTVASRSGKLTVGTIDGNPDSPLAYVPRADHSGYDPVVLLDRIDAKTNNFKRTSLRIAQRDPSGTWVETPILWREGGGITVSTGYFGGGQFVVKPSGAFGVLIPHCNIWVYMDRDPVTQGWRYFDVGSAQSVPSQVVATTDASGGVVLLERIYDANGRASIMGLLRESEGDFVELNGPPEAACANVPLTQVPTSAWETIDTGSDEYDGWAWDLRGITEAGGATFISAARGGQHRIVYRCSEAAAWNTDRLDQTHGRGMLQPVLDAAGNTIRAYSWGFYGTQNGPWIDQGYLAQEAGNGCGVVP